MLWRSPLCRSDLLWLREIEDEERKFNIYKKR